MIKPPRTMQEAVFAELFGELDGLSQRVIASQEAMTGLETRLKEVREAETTKAAKELSKAADKFGEVTTQSVDDFVSVANEALAKFMQRTEEIKTLLDRPISAAAVTQKTPQKQPPAAKTQPNKNQGGYSLNQAIGWAVFFYFLTCIGGLIFSFAFQFAVK